MGSTHRAFEATTHPRLPNSGAHAIAGRASVNALAIVGLPKPHYG